MYHFAGTQLRAVERFCNANSEYLKKTRIIILEHILPTTVEFVNLLKLAGSEIYAVIAKPYSINKLCLRKLKQQKIKVICESYNTLDNTPLLLDLLKEAVDISIEDGRKIIIIDVGGYFAGPLISLGNSANGAIAGVVEDTTFGHNRYYSNCAESKISVPVFSVARSPLKEIEARFVGRDAVSSMELVLRRIGISLSGRNALVIGYGMIGQNVAKTLRRYDLKVSVYDIEDYQNLTAYSDGYRIHKKHQLLQDADIIFSATGSEAIYNTSAISFKDIEDYCKDNVILASVGSRDTEFELDQIKRLCPPPKKISEFLAEYRIPQASKNLIVAKDGTAVNFISDSIPIEILDLVFSEIIMCIVGLIAEPEHYCAGVNLFEASGDTLNNISWHWLRSVNMQSM